MEHQLPQQDGVEYSELEARVREIGPLLSQQRAFGERRGRLADEAFQALRDAGLLKLWRPRTLGGSELDPPAYCALAEAVARHDTAAGWSMMAANNALFDLRHAKAELVERIFGEQPEALVIATYNKPFVAERVPGGFRVSGQAAFATGSAHADWIGHLALVHAGAEPVIGANGPELIVAYHRAKALEIVDDWSSLGLRGTSSNSIRADRAFVPEQQVIELSPAPAPNRYFESALYRCPLALVATALPPVALACLGVALESLRALAASKVPFASARPLAERPLAQLHYARALASERALRGLFEGEVRRMWQRACSGEAFGLAQKADIVVACTYALQECAAAVRNVASAAGTSAIYTESPIEGALRDSEVMRHHGFACESRFASAAQAYFGLEVDFPFLTL